VSCAVRINYAGEKTQYVYSETSYFVGIKVWAVSSRIYSNFKHLNSAGHC